MRVLFLMVLKIKYGAGYGYGYGYGYGGGIQMDILMRRNHGISMMQSRLQTKGKK
jgi:hypothetical protein